MPYAFSYVIPASEQMYRQVKEKIGDAPPEGMIVHLVDHVDGGLRHTQIWDSKEQWDRFHAERVEPAVRSVMSAAGFAQMPPDPPTEELALVDVWLGS